MNLLWWRKKKLNDFTLTITVDDSFKAGYGHLDTKDKIIVLSKNDTEIESTLAHELGHLMSLILRTPNAREKEFADQSGNILGLSFRAGDPNLKLEKEAWKFARMILPERINEEVAEASLRHYDKK